MRILSSSDLKLKIEERKNMLNNKEIELIEYMNYQVMNNGMDG